MACSQNFGLNVQDIIPLLYVIPDEYRNVQILSDFLKMDLPGFPIQFDIPLPYTLKANVTFKSFHQRQEVLQDKNLFAVTQYKLAGEPAWPGRNVAVT